MLVHIRAMKICQAILCILTCVWIVGCSTPDPVKGWKCHDTSIDPPNYHSTPQVFPYYHIDQAIIDDYQAFYKAFKLPHPPERIYIYEDGTGQHAVRMTVEFLTKWTDRTYDYYLIYDASNVRKKVIRINVTPAFGSLG